MTVKPADLDKLNARQEMFAQHFALHRNMVKAYRHAFDCTGRTPANVANMARITLAIPQVEARIRGLLDLSSGGTVETMRRIQQRLWDVITGDVNELVSLKICNCRYCHGEGHRRQWREHEYLAELDRVEHFNANRGAKQAPEPLPDPAGGFGFDETAPPHEDCPACSGAGEPVVRLRDTENLSPSAKALYGGVQQTATGLKVVVADKLKAVEMLVRILGGFDDKLRVSGGIETLAKSVTLTTTDPNEAERIYRDFVAGKLQVDAPVTTH